MRVILFTGKGGVGKTTCASATALQIAASGRKTLLMSTDPAHSIADAFDVALSSDAIEIATNLWAEQIDPQQRLEENWREIQQHAIAVLNWAGLGEVEAEELSIIPGLDELFALADVKRHHDDDPYDALVIDCAPTGETLRLLSLPDIIQWYMERIFPIERRVMGALRPVARRISSLPLPDDNVYAAVRRFYDKLDGVRRVLTDSRDTSVRLVVNPERMVIAEAQRTFTYLSLFGYRVDAIIANRLLPDAITDPYFARWKELQVEHLATIESSFHPVPILTARLHDKELNGAEALADLGAEIYDDKDPGAVLHDEEPMSIVKDGDDYRLQLRLPLTSKDDLDLSSKGDELFIKVGHYRRTVMLPKVLAARQISSARLERERLEVVFQPQT
ncbi:MAG: arsenite/tail-anchored protein-transporting ATPase [Actinomycetota bacterium]|jgi:arsenite-transporting ATPase|nr:arsenite/tail-anchored protein-transporting ATPase [Actinomycetota bacterium]